MSTIVNVLKRLLDLRLGRILSNSFEESSKSFGVLYSLRRTLSLCGKPTEPEVSSSIFERIVKCLAINIHCMSSIPNKYDPSFRPRVQWLNVPKLPQTDVVGQAEKRSNPGWKILERFQHFADVTSRSP